MLKYALKDIPQIEIIGRFEGKCVGCGSVGSIDAIRVPGDPGPERAYFEYTHCPECGTLSLRDIPEDLGAYYPSSYYSFSTKRAAGLKALLKSYRDRSALFRALPFSDLINRLSPYRGLTSLQSLFDGSLPNRFDVNSSVLDVGCGDGEKLSALKGAGLKNLTGIDPYMVKEHQEPGFRLLRRSIEEIDGVSDIVTYHHAMEHVVHPEQTMVQLRELVSDRGALVVRIPVSTGWAWREYGGEWAQLDAPRHINLFSPLGFVALAKRANWNVAKIVFDSAPLQFTGSLLRRKNINFHEDPGAFKRTFGKHDEAMFWKKADRLNAEQDGDQATFFLTKLQQS